MYGKHGRGSLTRRLATHQLRARHHYSNMKFLSHRVALTQHTPCGKTDGNSTSASHVEGCVEFAPKGTHVTRHAHQRSHTVFSGLLHVESCVHCRLPVLFVRFKRRSELSWRRFFQRWARTFSDRCWRVQSRLLLSMSHVSPT